MRGKKKIRQDRRKKILRLSESAAKPAEISQLTASLIKYPNDFDIRYRLAQACLDQNQPLRAYEIALPLAENTKPLEERKLLAAYRLLTFAGIQSNHLDEAHKFGCRGLALCREGLDFYFALALITARQRRYVETVKFAETYLSLWQDKNSDQLSRGDWDGTYRLRHQLLSAYGVALNETGRKDEAETVLWEAIAIEPAFDSSHVNLAVILKSRGREDEAREAVRNGLEHCPGSPELIRLAGWREESATISVCMIVKDEEEFLPRCLCSIKDAVDEIILVDTGSNDRTLDIAREFGCKIFHFPWTGDFSAARNESMKYATGDWIFIIDADEELPCEEIPRLRLVTRQRDVKVISISVINKNLETGRVTSFLPSIRLVRRELGLRYYGIVHNRLEVPPGVPALRSNLRLYHYGYDLPRDKLDKKLHRSQALLEKQLSADPKDVYANFNMAQLLRGFKDGNSPEICTRIVDHASRVIDSPESHRDIYAGHRLMAFHQKAVALCNLGRFDEAEECCRQALDKKPNYLDPILTLGDINNYLGRFDQAKKYYHDYLDRQKTYDAGKEIDNIILLNLEARHKAWFGLGLVAERQDERQEAVRAFEQVMEERGRYLDTFCRLGKLYLELGQAAKAEAIFRQEVEAEPDSAVAHYGLGCALAEQGRREEGLTCLQKSVELEPEQSERWFVLGQQLLAAGNRTAGLNAIQEAAELKPECTGVLFEVGNLFFGEGEFDRAIDSYNQALSLSPDHTETLNNLANCYFKIGQYENACQLYEQVVEKDQSFWLAYRNLGLCLARMNKAERGLQYLNQYSINNPQDTEAYKLIADLLKSIKKYGEACRCYEKYLSQRPNDHACMLNLSDTYRLMGAPEEAAMGYRQVLRLKPGFRAAEERLAELDQSRETPSAVECS